MSLICELGQLVTFFSRLPNYTDPHGGSLDLHSSETSFSNDSEGGTVASSRRRVIINTAVYGVVGQQRRPRNAFLIAKRRSAHSLCLLGRCGKMRLAESQACSPTRSNSLVPAKRGAYETQRTTASRCNVSCRFCVGSKRLTGAGTRCRTRHTHKISANATPG